MLARKNCFCATVCERGESIDRSIGLIDDHVIERISARIRERERAFVIPVARSTVHDRCLRGSIRGWNVDGVQLPLLPCPRYRFRSFGKTILLSWGGGGVINGDRSGVRLLQNT